MKNIFVTASMVVALAACLKELNDPVATVPSGDYTAPFAVTLSAMKPADCHTMTVEVSRNDIPLSDFSFEGPSDLMRAFVSIEISASTKLEVTLTPGRNCWGYNAKTVTFDYRFPAMPDLSSTARDMTQLGD